MRRLIWGRRMASPLKPAGSTESLTVSSGSSASTLVASASAFLNGSAGLSLFCAIFALSLSPDGLHLAKNTSGESRQRRGGGSAPIFRGLSRRGVLVPDGSPQAHAGRAFGQFLVKAALVELGHGLAFELVAFVEEGQPERIAHIAEDGGVLRPCDHRPGAHHRRELPVHEGGAAQVGDG